MEEEKTLSALDETIQAAETSFKEFIEVLETEILLIKYLLNKIKNNK